MYEKEIEEVKRTRVKAVEADTDMANAQRKLCNALICDYYWAYFIEDPADPEKRENELKKVVQEIRTLIHDKTIDIHIIYESHCRITGSFGVLIKV